MGSVLKVRDENGIFIDIPAIRGRDGKSAYEQAVEGGYTGTEEEFITLLASLHGIVPGADGKNIGQIQENLGLAYYTTYNKHLNTMSPYGVDIPGITELKPGVVARVLFHELCDVDDPTLDVNGLGAKPIRRYQSDGHTIGDFYGYCIWPQVPLELVYNGTYWLATGLCQPRADDLVGILPISRGGTGSNTVDPTPTEGSLNMVTSEGIYYAIEKLQSQINAINEFLEL